MKTDKTTAKVLSIGLARSALILLQDATFGKIGFLK